MLAGREELLAELHARLSRGDGQGPRIVALHGLGGAGKTSVAVEYAHRQLAAAGVVWQFPAEDQAVLAAEFSRLAAQLGVAGGLLDPRDPVASVHAVLAASGVPWLLVFDNAPDQDSVRAFLPPAGDGRVLITSRSALWPPGQDLEVPVLDTDVAAGFLTARTGDSDVQAAAGLAVELGGLPLALEQAGAYIQAAAGSLAGYLADFRQRRTDLLARGEPAGYGRTVTTTWRLAFERLEQSAPAAAGLLRLLACCAPEPVPLLLLQPWHGIEDQLSTDVAPVLALLQGDPLAAGDAVAALRRYSLVTPAEDGLVLVHRLVQAVTLNQMPDPLAAGWRQAAAAVIEAAIPADTQPPATWPACAVLLPHAQAALADESSGMARIANYLGVSGSRAAARDLLTGVTDARIRVLGPEHPDTLDARVFLTRWTGAAGDAAAARDQCAALPPAYERVSGPEHPDTLDACASLAHWTGMAGDAAAARAQYAALLPAYERISGPEHPDTLTHRTGLARWTGEAGDAAAARDQYAALVSAYERESDPEHPDTLTARAGLARWTGMAGDAAAARDQCAALLLPACKRIYGLKHPDTLNARAELAYWTGRAGDAAAARDQYATLLPAYERISGPEHPDTMNARANLIIWTGEAGDAAAARDQFAALLPVRERVSGPEHPDTLDTRAELARLTGEAGDTAAARDQFAALLPVRERVSGPEHPDTLDARANLAYWTTKARRQLRSRRRHRGGT